MVSGSTGKREDEVRKVLGTGCKGKKEEEVGNGLERGEKGVGSRYKGKREV